MGAIGWLPSSASTEMGKVIRVIFFAAIGLLMSRPSQGACTKPDAPSCAIEGAFASVSDWDRCRIQMIAYKGGMETFIACLQKDGQDGETTERELEYTLSEFNRRSRALPDEGL
jgi:hypothetical protein